MFFAVGLPTLGNSSEVQNAAKMNAWKPRDKSFTSCTHGPKANKSSAKCWERQSLSVCESCLYQSCYPLTLWVL